MRLPAPLPGAPPDRAHPNPHRGEAVRLRLLQPALPAEAASDHPRQETPRHGVHPGCARVSQVRQGLLPLGEPPESPSVSPKDASISRGGGVPLL